VVDILSNVYLCCCDLDEEIRNLILKFADDTKVFEKVVDDKDKCKLQKDLNKLALWAQKWKIEFNVTKCIMQGYAYR